MSNVWLGIDLGTSGVKVVAIDADGLVLATENATYPLHSPRPGWVEQDPLDWWEATHRATRALVARLVDQTIVALGLTGQMHGLVALDATGAVLRDAILWNDNRTGRQCEWLLERVGGLDGLLALTNNAALPGYTIGKILWVREHEPDLFERIDVVLNPKDYLRYRLTGDRVTDVSDASGTGALDVRRRAWSTELLEALDLRASLLPPVVESSEITGRLSTEMAAHLGIPPGTPVVAGGGDSVLQTTSMGVESPGLLGITLGTGGIMGAASDSCPENVGGRVQVSCGNAPNRWQIMGVSLSTGGALEWWRQALTPLTGQRPATEELARWAAQSPVGARGLSFLPYLVGERCPHTDTDARAAWVDLDLRHDVTDMTRAVIEGALLNLRQIRDILTELGLATDVVRVSGGASAHPIWTQTLADVLGSPIHSVTRGEHGAAYGAALLAGIGTSQWSSLQNALADVVVTDTVHPQADNVLTHDHNYARWIQLYPALHTHPQGDKP